MDYGAKKSVIINLLFVFLCVFTVLVASKLLLGYLLPFVFGTFLAYAVQRPARFLSAKLHLPTGICAAILVALLFLVCAALIGFIGFKLFYEAAELLAALPKQLNASSVLFERFDAYIGYFAQSLPEGIADTVLQALKNSVGNIVSTITSGVSQLAGSFATALPRYLLSLAVTVVASCYIAKDFERLVRFLRSLIRRETFKNITVIKDIFIQSVLKLVGGYGILAIITFVELTAAFFILKIKYGIVIAAIIAIVDLLPVLGSGTVLLPWAAVCFIGGNMSRGVALCVVYLIITVIRYLIEPRIIAGRMGADPLLTLIALFLGLKFGGLGGMLLFPIVCIVVIEYYKRQINEETNSHQTLRKA